MSGLMDIISQQLGGDGMKQLSRQIGADEKATEGALGAALPTLLAALTRNAQKPDGAKALHDAINRDHDGSILERGAAALGDQEARAGDGILKHVLGERRGNVENNLSRATGLDGSSTNKLMSMLAPMVMGALGKQQRQGGLDASGLSQMLMKERQAVEQKAPTAKPGMFDALLDADGDGDTDLMDMLKHGSGLLGKLGGR